MTIEVRQILIKASVTKRPGDETRRDEALPNSEALKQDILEACRNLVLEVLREEKER